MADGLTVANTTLCEMVQVRWNTTFVLHPPVKVPELGCTAVNLHGNKWSGREERFISSHPHEIRQACLRRSLSFMSPTRLRMYKVRVREQIGIYGEEGAAFITVEYVDENGRAILLDNDEVSRLRVIIAELWTHPKFIIFEVSLLGAHPIKHLPHSETTYRKWLEWVSRSAIAEYLYVRDKRIIYYPRLDEAVNSLVEVEELVWESLRTFFGRYNHLGVPLDLDYQIEAQQVLAYHLPDKKITDTKNPPLDNITNGVRPIVYLQEYFRWYHFLDVHVSVDGSVRTNTGRLVSELYKVPTWPSGKLLLSANPLWVITFLEHVNSTRFPVEYFNGLYLVSDTEQHRGIITTLRGPINDRVSTLHSQGMYATLSSESYVAISPSKALKVVDGQLLGRDEHLLVIQTTQPAIVSRVLLAYRSV